LKSHRGGAELDIPITAAQRQGIQAGHLRVTVSVIFLATNGKFWQDQAGAHFKPG
jgi:hypothetical protein